MNQISCPRYERHEAEWSIGFVSNPNNSRDVKYRMVDMLKECLTCRQKTDACTEELQEDFYQNFIENRNNLLWKSNK